MNILFPKSHLVLWNSYEPEAIAIVWVWSWVVGRGEGAINIRKYTATAI